MMKLWWDNVRSRSNAVGLGALWVRPNRAIREMNDKELAANGQMLDALERSMSTKGELKEFRELAREPSKHSQKAHLLFLHFELIIQLLLT